ncbi:MAG: cell filamentation protein Fic [Shewanella sp.]|nr:cell filamentation protein Fic [Shewanella sp.]
MRDKYGVSQDKYCYQGTDVLINRLNIQNADELDEAETRFTSERYKSYQSNCSSITDFNFKHLKFLHKHLFQDLYVWAGEVRDVDISKGNTRFCTAGRIEPESDKLFKQLPKLFESKRTESFIHNVSDLFCELNLLHPFREGNGRTLRFFFEELLYLLDYDVEWPGISQREWIDANIAGLHLDLSPLENIFKQAVSPLPTK